MRSLWRMIASQWLGGEGSEALRGHSTALDVLLSHEYSAPIRTFEVRREAGVSHRAIMTRGSAPAFDPAIEKEADEEQQ